MMGKYTSPSARPEYWQSGPIVKPRRPPPGDHFIPRDDADAKATRAFLYGMVVGAIVFAAGLIVGALT